MQPRAVGYRIKYGYAVVFPRVALRHRKPLLTSGRAADVVGMLRLAPVIRLGDFLACARHHAYGVVSEIRGGDVEALLVNPPLVGAQVAVGGGVAAVCPADRRL